MTITAGLVLYAVIWFLCLFVALPIRVTTQGEDGSVVPGTPSSAPADPMMKRKLLWTTAAACVIWAAIAGVILFGGLTMRDLDFWGRM
jgi:predicted secreted protein